MIFDQLDFKEEKVMDNEKIEKLQQMIDESDHIVFFGGAGVSTESHIPDFRSTDGFDRLSSPVCPAAVPCGAAVFLPLLIYIGSIGFIG